MKKILSVLLCVFILFSFSACKERGTDSDEAKKSGKLLIGVTDNQPLTYKQNGVWTGFDAELARMFAKKLGVEAEFVEIEYDKKYDKLADYSIDCIWTGLTIGDYQQEDFSISNPYVYNSQVLVMKSDVVSKYQNGYNVRNLKFAVQTDSSGYYAVDREKYKNLTIVATQKEALGLVADGSVDATVVDGIVADALIGEGNLYPNLSKGFSYSSESYGVAFRKGSDLTKLFNDFLTEVKENALWELAEKYGLTLAQ